MRTGERRPTALTVLFPEMMLRDSIRRSVIDAIQSNTGGLAVLIGHRQADIADCPDMEAALWNGIARAETSGTIAIRRSTAFGENGGKAAFALLGDLDQTHDVTAIGTMIPIRPGQIVGLEDLRSQWEPVLDRILFMHPRRSVLRETPRRLASNRRPD